MAFSKRCGSMLMRAIRVGILLELSIRGGAKEQAKGEVGAAANRTEHMRNNSVTAHGESQAVDQHIIGVNKTIVASEGRTEPQRDVGADGKVAPEPATGSMPLGSKIALNGSTRGGAKVQAKGEVDVAANGAERVHNNSVEIHVESQALRDVGEGDKVAIEPVAYNMLAGNNISRNQSAAVATSPGEAPKSRLRGDVAAMSASTRFMSYNVYYANLGGRAHEVARGIAQVAPEIASLQESIQDRSRIVEELIRITGQQWSLVKPPGNCVWYWDGAIIYRSDIWEELSNGRVPYGGGGCYDESLRALSWAALRRRSDRQGVLVYGTHPICCRGDWPILQAMELISREMAAGQQRWGFPIALMADMNTGFYEPSQALLREGWANGFGRGWQVPMKFVDAWAELHPRNPNPSTIQQAPVRLDYVYFQREPQMLGQVVQSQVWSWLPGGSDHRAVSADVVIR